MESSEKLSHRFREVLLCGQWIANTNYKESLDDVEIKEALHKVGSLNTIALLTFHINYYIHGILEVFEGGDLTIKDQYSFDMPVINSENQWHKMKQELTHNAEKFASCVEKMDEAQLAAPFVLEKYGDYRRNIEAMIEHAYYHLGQISLLKKMIRSSR